MHNIQKDNILDFIKIELLSINLDCDLFFESKLIAAEEIDCAHLSIDKFVAKLWEKELRVFFSDFMEIFTNFSIKPYT